MPSELHFIGNPDTSISETELQLTWNQCADFYFIDIAYVYADSQKQVSVWLNDSMSVFVTTDTVLVVPGKYLPGNGTVFFGVLPISGPCPPSISPNLHGNGYGWLHTVRRLTNTGICHKEIAIEIGSGLGRKLQHESQILLKANRFLENSQIVEP